MTEAASSSTRGDTRQAEGSQGLRGAWEPAGGCEPGGSGEPGGGCEPAGAWEPGGGCGPGGSWRPGRGEGRDVTSANI